MDKATGEEVSRTNFDGELAMGLFGGDADEAVDGVVDAFIDYMREYMRRRRAKTKACKNGKHFFWLYNLKNFVPPTYPCLCGATTWGEQRKEG